MVRKSLPEQPIFFAYPLSAVCLEPSREVLPAGMIFLQFGDISIVNMLIKPPEH